jgi:hypothetical protein
MFRSKTIENILNQGHPGGKFDLGIHTGVGKTKAVKRGASSIGT